MVRSLGEHCVKKKRLALISSYIHIDYENFTSIYLSIIKPLIQGKGWDVLEVRYVKVHIIAHSFFSILGREIEKENRCFSKILTNPLASIETQILILYL